MHGLDGNDFAAQGAQVANLVNHVDQDGSTTLLSAPYGGIEIVIRLVEHGAPLHRDNIAEYAFADYLSRLGEDRTVCSMVSYQQTRAL
ncbi:hypothetical protein [Pseudomonas sp. 22 E 5]|nr:hypothetical protein [Pseudomonas sp. 22 E 5]